MRDIKFRQLLDDGTWHYWGFLPDANGSLQWIGPALNPRPGEVAGVHSRTMQYGPQGQERDRDIRGGCCQMQGLCFWRRT